MKYLYFRCNGGHYFRSALACPFDGWSCDGLRSGIDAFDALRAEGVCPTVATLRERGVSAEVIQRILLIEFGNDASTFDALVPERYIHRGRELLAHEVGSELY